MAALFYLLALSLACVTSAPASSSADGTPAPSQDAAKFQQGRVVSVIDGATIEVESEGATYRARYIGVDVPAQESDGALRFNRFLVEGKRVQLERDPADSDPTSLLRYVYVSGEMVNLALIASGHAIAAPIPPGFARQADFLLAEKSARANQRGVWGQWPSSQETEQAANQPASPSPIPEFTGGTLPLVPQPKAPLSCDYSGTLEPVIKGVVGGGTGERIYYVPGDPSYDAIAVDRAQGGQWFCTEDTAISFGWKRASG